MPAKQWMILPPKWFCFPKKNRKGTPTQRWLPRVWLNHQPLRASIYHLLSGHLQNPKKFIGLSEFIYLPRVPTVAVYLSTSLSSLESNLDWSSLIMSNQTCLSFIHAITFPLPSHYLPILCPSHSSFMDPAPTCCSRAMLCSLANADPSVAMPTGRWSNNQRNILAM